MVLGFDKRFIDPIRTGMKIHTLREDRLLRWKAGMTIQMATGIRTKQYKCFNETLCRGIQKVQILLDSMPQIWVDGKYLQNKEIELLAKNDGFYELSDFVTWFSKSKYLRDAGDNMIELRIIHWSDFRY